MPKHDFKLATIIRKGFTQHQELNPKIFNENQILRDDVRKKLIIIANDFIDSLHIDHIDFEDILLIGSIANYNWNPYSDVDLHVVYDFESIDADRDLVTEFFLAKKSEWNQDHNITIYGYDVELYGQDVNDSTVSGGIYSVLKNEWVHQPKPEEYEISEESLIKKTKHFMRLIDDVLNLNASDITKIEKLKVIKNKIRKYRKSGLENGGEYSEENLVFKMLRRTGYMEKLSDSRHKLEDKLMSLPEGLNLPKKQTPQSWFQKILNQTTGPHTTPDYPNSLFYKLDGNLIFEYDQESEFFWVDYDEIWLVFRERFGMDYDETQELIKSMVEEHYNLVDVTPRWAYG